MHKDKLCFQSLLCVEGAGKSGSGNYFGVREGLEYKQLQRQRKHMYCFQWQANTLNVGLNLSHQAELLSRLFQN